MSGAVGLTTNKVTQPSCRDSALCHSRFSPNGHKLVDSTFSYQLKGFNFTEAFTLHQAIF